MSDDLKETLDRLSGALDDAYAVLINEADDARDTRTNMSYEQRLRDLAGFLTVASYGIESAVDEIKKEDQS